MDQLAQLIVFLEIDAKEIIDLIKDVEPICNFIYPYEYHVTVGWFADGNPDILRKRGHQTVNYIREQLLKLDCKLLIEKDSIFQVVINGSGRQPVSRGGGFYLQPTEQSTQHLVKIHNKLAAFLQRSHIRTSEFISNYYPHVSFTTPISLDTINQHQEKMILKAISDKIVRRQGTFPGKVVFQPVAIRTILKYRDEQGNEQRETWDVKKLSPTDLEGFENTLKYSSSSHWAYQLYLGCEQNDVSLLESDHLQS